MSANIICGDNREVLRSRADATVDAVVTDPPYSLGFMGKKWDASLPTVELWREVLRVAKPGAYMLAFGAPRTHHRLTCAIEDAGWEIHDCIMWLFGSGFPKHKSKLKPAYEPIVLARKPAKGATLLNIEGCRLSSEGLHEVTQGLSTRVYGNGEGLRKERGNYTVPSGRWPANLALDEDAAAALDEMSGERAVSGSARNGGHSTATPESIFGGARPQGALHNDSGGASRFFYTSKASRAERNYGLDGFALRDAQKLNPSGIGARRAADGLGQGRNHHATVKPLDLMRWLVRLVTPPAGIVLDPFAGSGTTGCACVAEGFPFVGIEIDAEYAEIACHRIAAIQAPLWQEARDMKLGGKGDDA